MNEYRCEFCNSTGTELRNEEKGCCNNCGAPIGITKEEANKIYEDYYANLPFMSTADAIWLERSRAQTWRIWNEKENN